MLLGKQISNLQGFYICSWCGTVSGSGRAGDGGVSAGPLSRLLVVLGSVGRLQCDCAPGGVRTRSRNCPAGPGTILLGVQETAFTEVKVKSKLSIFGFFLDRIGSFEGRTGLGNRKKFDTKINLTVS